MEATERKENELCARTGLRIVLILLLRSTSLPIHKLRENENENHERERLIRSHDLPAASVQPSESVSIRVHPWLKLRR